MKKSSTLGLAITAMILAACQSQPATQVGDSFQKNPRSITPAVCTIVSPRPTPGPTEQSIFPPVSDKDWVEGPDNAYVTILEYSDFQCPSCAGLAPVLARIRQDFSQDVRIVYRHFPLISIHDKAALAAQAAEAAGIQDRFWEMHDRLFDNQSQWTPMGQEEFAGWLSDQARELELDEGQFMKDLSSQPIKDLVQKAWDHNIAIGLSFTPFLLVNGQIYPNGLPMDFGNISGIIKLNLLEKNQFTSCPPFAIDISRQYFATLHTEKGDIVIELYTDNAPFAVNNFIFLVRNGWYDGVTFHRVIAGFVAQAGDPSGTGFGGPGYAFANEISPNLKFDKAGVVGMANAGPDTNGSQFFITLAATPNLDGNFTIFGQVIEGLDVVQSLTLRDPATATTAGDKILSIDIDEK